MSAVPGFVRPLRPRDPAEPHRAATPLELFTDLCFVVAVAQAATGLHHGATEGHLGAAGQSYALAFFAIWWAWLNFSWFASAYDNDDVVYRLLTLLQIVGSLVLAAGVSRMFDDDFILGVIGYVIMRVALVAQWWRASLQDAQRRRTCRRYAVGIILVQCLWVLYLFLPDGLGVAAFVVFAACELVVPVWAEHAGQTPWHPHHIAERYGLFFIIVLGETILSTTVAIQQALDEDVRHGEVAYVVVGGLLIVFSMWWLYFSRDAGVALARVQGQYTYNEYLWGFGHYFVFASAAAIGAGLAVRVDYWTGHGEVTAVQSAALVTVPVAVLLVAMWAICVRVHDASARTWAPFGVAVALVLLCTFTGAAELWTGIVCAVLLVVELRVASLVPAAD